MPALTLKELRSKVTQKGDDIAALFKETKIDGASVADGQWDFTKAKSFGLEGKSAVDVADWLQERNTELAEITDDLTARVKVQQAGENNDARQKAARKVQHPASAGGEARGSKSLGATVTEEKDFLAWSGKGAAGGVNFHYPDMYPSDMLSKGMVPETIGTKTLLSTSAGWDPESIRLPGFVEAVTRPIQLLDIIPLAQTGFDTIKYMEETTRTHAAEETAEGATYKESTFVFTEKTSIVRKITDSLPVTDEQLADVAQVNSYINGRLVFGLRQRLDSQVLVGAGTGILLDGIKNVSGILTTAKGVDPTPDAFFKAMTAIRLTGRAMPTHHIVHPTDWQQVRLLRTADGVYIWGNPSESGPERMWGLPVVQSDADSAGTGYCGSFQPAWISLFERQGVDIQIGFTGSQFVEGKRTIRADMRFAFLLSRPAAFSTVTGI